MDRSRTFQVRYAQLSNWIASRLRVTTAPMAYGKFPEVLTVKRSFRTKLVQLLVGVSAIMVGSATSAEIYQWKDKDGQTVFSETAPPDAAGKVVKPKFGKESPAAIEKLKAQTAPPKVVPEGASKTAAKPKEPTVAEKKANCAKARDILTQLKTSTRLRVKDEKGEVSYVPEADRKKRVSDTQKSIDSWCK